VIAVDTNLLVYGHREDSEWHKEALSLITRLAASGNRWTIPWPCLHEFIAITTHPRIYNPPTPLKLAFATLTAWNKSPGMSILGEGPGYLEKLERISIAGKVAGPKIHDARIAAICLNHGVKELWSADRDFSRFPSLKVRNPLAG
jgi:toxin-antitoxin system PIN domain toxin